MNRNLILLAGALLGVVTMRSAAAHVVLAGREAPAGSYYQAVFDVPHGCHGAATTALEVDLPEGVVIAKPQPKPGWRLTIRHAALAQPVTNEGHELHERVTSIRWQGGPLPNDEFDTFVILVRLPITPGRLAFPAVQTCGRSKVEWTEPPMPDASGRKPPHPAPSLMLTKGLADH